MTDQDPAPPPPAAPSVPTPPAAPSPCSEALETELAALEAILPPRKDSAGPHADGDSDTQLPDDDEETVPE